MEFYLQVAKYEFELVDERLARVVGRFGKSGRSMDAWRQKLVREKLHLRIMELE